MDGPWSQYAPATSSAPPPAAAGPWTQYAPQKADASPAPATPDMSAQSEFPTYAAPASGDAAPDNAARGFGVGVRNVAEGLAGSLPGQAVDALTWPGRALLRAAGAHVTAPSDMVSEGLTEAGVPEAETPGEKLRGSAISGAASMLPTMGLGSIAALAEKSPALAKAFADGIIGQLTGGAASGIASEGTRQLGGGPVAQTVAGMAGGVVGGVAGTRVPGSESAPSPKMYGEAFAPDVSQLDSRNAIQALIQHDINENPVIPGRAPDFGAANQGAEAIAAIGAAPDIDTAIAAASKAAQSPGERPMAQWMQPISRDVAPSIEQVEAPSGSSGLAQTAPTIDDALTSDAATPQSMSDYLGANNRQTLAPTVQPEALTSAIEARNVPATSQAAKQIASAYYQKADDVGGVLTPEFANRFVDEAEQIAPQTNEGKIVLGNSPVTNLIDRIQNLRDQPISLQGAQEIDEGLGNLISNEFGPVGLSKEGKNLLDLQTTFRDMIMHAGPEDIEGGTEGFDALSQGRVAWSQAMKMGDLERIVDRAELTDNPATSIKSGLRVLLSNPARARGYSPAEISALRSAADRGVLGGVLHVFGSRLIPYAAGAAGSVGGPVGAMTAAGAGYVGSTLMRNAASALQTRRIGNAMSVLGEGVPAPPAP